VKEKFAGTAAELLVIGKSVRQSVAVRRTVIR